MIKSDGRHVRSEQEARELRERLEEQARGDDELREGGVDADKTRSAEGPRVYTMTGADQLYRVMVEAMPLGAATLRADGTIYYCNPQLSRMLGVSCGALLGRSFRELAAPESRPQFDAMIRGSHGPERFGRAEIELVCAGDVRRPVSLTASWLPFSDAELVCLLASDLTEQKRQEAVNSSAQLASAILDHAAEAILLCDLEGLIIRANRAAARLCGASGQGPLLLRPLADVLPLRHAGSSEPVALPLCVEGAELQGVEVALERPGEAPVELLMSVGCLRGGQREAVGYVVAFTDVTALKRLGDELKRATTAAEAASPGKSQFLANMSHELRTPMNTILAMTELALGQELPVMARDCLVTAKDSADSLLMLLDDALDLSRIEAGRFELDRASFDLRRGLDRAVKPLALRAAQNGLDLALTIPPDVPERVVGDPLRLRQVLTNLVGNAIKFTDAGRIDVRARVVEREASHALLELTVADTGIGIPEEDRERIFDAFTQVDASTTRRRGGPGLGLSISRRLVEQMGGRLWVESRPGEGSTFHATVRLDVVDVGDPDLGVGAGGPLTPLPERARRSLRVLVVEDTPASRKLAQFILHRRGHTTEIASDGRQALELVRRFPFDVVLMDVQMPVMDGLKATEAIRALDERVRARVPIIAMNAHALKGEEERCLAVGMDACLSKPIDGVKLVQLVERLGDRRRDPQPPFDLGEAIGKCFGRESVFRDMVACCFDEAGALVAGMRSAIAEPGAGAGDRLAASAHRLKGTVVYLAAPRALDAIRRVEQIGKSGDLAQANAAVDALEQQLSHLMEALAPYRSIRD